MSYLVQHTQIIQAIAMRVKHCVEEAIKDVYYALEEIKDNIGAGRRFTSRQIDELFGGMDRFDERLIALERKRRDNFNNLNRRLQQLELLDSNEDRINELEDKVKEHEEQFHDQEMEEMHTS